MKNILKIIGGVAFIASATFAQQMTEITNWVMQDSSAVSEKTGEGISTSTFSTSGWYKATVPGTVLSTLEDQGVSGFTNLYSGTTISSVADIAGQQRRYWYRASFNVTFSAGQRVWLNIEGINYQAYIFVNGQSVGTMLGAFKGGKFDITSMVTSGTNYLAVKIRGPYTPGSIKTSQLTGTCGNNGGVMTGDGPTMIASQGWDWIPTIPDRDMGIWKPVYIRVTGPVAVRTPWIRTTTVSTSSATIQLQATLLNSTGTAVSGSASADINGTTQFTAQTATVPANGSVTVTFPNLAMNNPQLWWPNGYGDPHLYTCNISFTPSGGSVSDTTTFPFGVRQWTYSTSPYLTISCNGQRILCRGGNWGMDDAMKRWDIHKTENKIRYHKEMNFNVIRDWLGMTDNEPFYQLCDKYGMIVWSDFWQPYGPGVSDGPEPTDLTLFENNELDKILRARNHACIAIWCARNETAPNATLLPYLQNLHSTYDGTRRVQPSSGSDGAHSGGPYSWTAVQSVYTSITGFHTEFGPQTVPNIESLNMFLSGQWPINNTWSFHNYCTGNQTPADYTAAVSAIWGAPSNITDFSVKAQLLNYDELRAAFESLQAKRFSGATGLLLWMSNCVWPSTVWQTYDYYMEGTGSMFGSQKGSEPIHVQYYSPANSSIQVFNNTRNALSNYTVSAATYNLNGAQAWSNSQTISSIPADGSANAFGITAGSTTPYFLDLKLKDASGNVVSKNFYWLPDNGSSTSGMMTMGQTTIAATTSTAAWTKSGSENTITLKVVNSGSVCAVACRLLLTSNSSGARILPVHYNDNYFSLIPKDTQSVIIKFDDVDLNGNSPKLCLTGINVPQTCYTISGVVPVLRGDVAERKAGGIYTMFNGKNLRMYNVSSGSAWQLTMINMEGQTVLNARGIGNGNVATVSTASLRSGMYVAMLRSGNDVFRSMVTISEHGVVR
jgi:Beta-galactosidase/beta-glucuronidase